MNTENFKDGDFRERKKKNVFHFRSKVIKEFFIVSRIRREINRTDIFSLRVKGELQPECRKFRTVKFRNTRVWQVVVCINKERRDRIVFVLSIC